MPPNNQSSYGYGPVPGFDPNQPIQLPKHKVNNLLVPLITVILLLVTALGFGIWAFMERDTYKNRSDQKAAEAVAAAEAKITDQLEAEFAEREKQPFKAYTGPATYGSIDIKYPKTWSAYIDTSNNGSVPIDGYLHPDFVPGIKSGTAFALHFQVTNVTYDQELQRFDTLAKSGRVNVSPTAVPNVPNVAGVRISGEIESGKQGTLVMFPVRDKTFKISSESQVFAGDFNEIILKNLRFVP